MSSEAFQRAERRVKLRRESLIWVALSVAMVTAALVITVIQSRQIGSPEFQSFNTLWLTLPSLIPSGIACALRVKAVRLESSPTP